MGPQAGVEGACSISRVIQACCVLCGILGHSRAIPMLHNHACLIEFDAPLEHMLPYPPTGARLDAFGQQRVMLYILLLPHLSNDTGGDYRSQSGSHCKKYSLHAFLYPFLGSSTRAAGGSG